MRLRLTIRPLQRPCAIPINYNYYLSSAIYRWIAASSPEYSAFLHERGFQPEGVARRFKHFCFSRLEAAERTVRGDRLHVHSPVMTWYVGMPVEESLQHLVVGMFERREFFIERDENLFVVEQVESLPEPRWERRMRFRMLSPVTVSVAEKKNGRPFPRYLYADDPRLSAALRDNIMNKYRSLYGSADLGEGSDGWRFVCTTDARFIADRGGRDHVSTLITLKQGRSDETRVRAFLCPVTIEGDERLIRLAYDSGLGEKNSMGFGMIEA